MLTFISCNKIEGQGGKASIKGTLKVIDVNNAGEVVSTFLGADEDIYLIYGKDKTLYNDKMSTSHDGSFQFNYLIPGNYQVFAYSKCGNCDSGKNAKILDVVISSKKEIVDIGEIIVND